MPGSSNNSPQFGAATISAPVAGVMLDVAIKRPTQRQDLMWMEWFVINDEQTGIADARFVIEDLDPTFVVYDLGADLWNGPLPVTELTLGGVAPEGVTRLIVGIGTADGSALADHPLAALEFSVTVSGRATRFARNPFRTSRVKLCRR